MVETTRGSLDSLLEPFLNAAGDTVSAVVHFGSHVSGASPGHQSAHDLVVVVSDPLDFYTRTRDVLPAPRGPRSLTRLQSWLPPNILRMQGSEGHAGAKVFVTSDDEFTRSMRDGEDHFFRGRLMQRVRIVHARDDSARATIEERIRENRRGALDWALPFVPHEFDVDDFARTMLRVSYRGEIRPESSARVDEVFLAQQEWLRATYGPILEEARESGRLGGESCYRHRQTSAWHRFVVKNYFRKSKARATLRWLKYLLTFDDWAGYIAAKVERRTGKSVEITDRERRYPLILLWPKLIRVLRSRNPSGITNHAAGRGKT